MDNDDEYELEAPLPPPPVDVRAAAAQQYVRAATQPKGAKPPAAPAKVRWPFLRGVFLFPWQLSTLATWVLMTIGLMCGLLAATACYYFLGIDVALGCAIGVPSGMLVAVALSYASASFLAVVQATSEGFATVEDWPDGNWRDWFWTLPTTLGMLALASVPGGLLSALLPWPAAALMAATAFLLYPVLLLSTLETGSLSAPLSLAILQSLAAQPFAWLAVYLEMAVLTAGLALLTWATWANPPFVAVLVISAPLAAYLLIYSRLLGRLAWWCSTRTRQRI